MLFNLMRRIISLLFLVIMFNLISCQKCRECQTMRNGVVVHVEDWCYSGPNAKENIKEEEDVYRQLWNGPDDVVTCRDK
jgi:hypothetical protein